MDRADKLEVQSEELQKRSNKAGKDAGAKSSTKDAERMDQPTRELSQIDSLSTLINQTTPPIHFVRHTLPHIHRRPVKDRPTLKSFLRDYVVLI
eukprot:CFRG6570T1